MFWCALRSIDQICTPTPANIIDTISFLGTRLCRYTESSNTRRWSESNPTDDIFVGGGGLLWFTTTPTPL